MFSILPMTEYFNFSFKLSSRCFELNNPSLSQTHFQNPPESFFALNSGSLPANIVVNPSPFHQSARLSTPGQHVSTPSNAYLQAQHSRLKLHPFRSNSVLMHHPWLETRKAFQPKVHSETESSKEPLRLINLGGQQHHHFVRPWSSSLRREDHYRKCVLARSPFRKGTLFA